MMMMMMESYLSHNFLFSARMREISQTHCDLQLLIGERAELGRPVIGTHTNAADHDRGPVGPGRGFSHALLEGLGRIRTWLEIGLVRRGRLSSLRSVYACSAVRRVRGLLVVCFGLWLATLWRSVRELQWWCMEMSNCQIWCNVILAS